MPQVGIYSAYQLGLHNHLNATQGGILNDYSRHGAYRIPQRTGGLAIHTAAPGETFTGLNVMTLLKELRIDETRPGRVQVNYDYWSLLGGANNVNARFYVNGVAVGALQTGPGPTTVTENYDVGFTNGDLLQIWGRRIAAGDECHIDNFYIAYDWHLLYFGDGTINNLVTTLPLTDADDLLNTVIM